ncbi:MAG: proline--tRNA ligase [Candidatus Margulisiibacteriota bacterium]
MKMSRLLAPTLREDPGEAEVPSHRLMLRAGMIRKLAAGVYDILPLGLRVIHKVSNIIREEMNRSGAQEVLLPTLLPAEMWQETGRWGIYGKELFRIQDRHERDFCLGPTHEEIITDLVRKNVRSYKQLPINLYQIQTKFRDEIRPRFGVMRSREFIMKDSYSFHDSEASLEEEYKNMFHTYCRIFDRMGLNYKVVEADSGAIGGGFSQEFMVLADTGEEEIFYCESCGYAASRESAGVGKYKIETPNSKLQTPKEVHTPGKKTIEEVAEFLKVKPEQMIKSLIYETEKGPVLGLVRGDHELNEAKLKKVLGVEEVRLADEKVIEKVTKAVVGFAGPVGLKDIKIVADNAVVMIEDGVTGANKTDHHLVHVVFERDYKPDIIADIRFALHRDICPKCEKSHLNVTRGIEVGHIFKLGTKYSAKMNAVYLDENNQEKPYIMGCYGIGVGRTAAAAIEQSYDKDGIIWPNAIAPFVIDIIIANTEDKDQVEAAEKIYQALPIDDTILDDRPERIGVKLKDADLIGFPIKVIIGKALKEGKIEVKSRKTGEIKLIELDKAAEELAKYVR